MGFGSSPSPIPDTSSGRASTAPTMRTTIPHVILATAAARPDEDALILPDDSAVSFRAYVKRIREVAAGLVGLGVAPGQAVGVFGANSVEWRCAHLGATFAAAVAVGVHPAAPADAVVAALTATAAVVLFVDAQRVEAVIALAPRLPLVHTVVVWGCRVAPPHPWLLHWKGLVRRGLDAVVYGVRGGRSPRSAAAEVAARLEAATPDAPAAVAFTSGTGATSRGVVLSHTNVVAVLAGFSSRLGGGGSNRRGERIGVSYLPLGHVLPLMVDVYGAAMLAITLYLIDHDASWGDDHEAGAGAPPTTVIGDLLRSVEPTYLVAPPAVLEEMHDAVVAWVESDGPGLPTAVVSAAVAAGARASAADAARAEAAAAASSSHSGSGSSDGDTHPPRRRTMRLRRGSISLSLANRLLLKTMRGGLGLGSCAALLVSAAPLRADTAAFFTSLHLPPLNVYGLSETAGPVAGETPDAFSLSPSSAGRTLPGAEVAIRGEGPGGVGEILVRGLGVALGYAAGPLPPPPRRRRCHGGCCQFSSTRATGRICKQTAGAGGRRRARGLPTWYVCAGMNGERRVMSATAARGGRERAESQRGAPRSYGGRQR